MASVEHPFGVLVAQTACPADSFCLSISMACEIERHLDFEEEAGLAAIFPKNCYKLSVQS